MIWSYAGAARIHAGSQVLRGLYLLEPVLPHLQHSRPEQIGPLLGTGRLIGFISPERFREQIAPTDRKGP